MQIESIKKPFLLSVRLKILLPTKPANIEPMDKIISGIVIVFGDSWAFSNL